jgi:hypothetical protein
MKFSLPFLLFFALIQNCSSQTLDWVKKIGGSDSDVGQSIAIDLLGNTYSTGSFQGTVDFNPNTGVHNLSSQGDIDMFIIKLTTTGAFLWAKNIGGPTSITFSKSITTDDSSNIYCTGYFQGIVDFDPGVGTANLVALGTQDIFILKLDSLGNYIWAKSIGGSNIDIGNFITLDEWGNIYITGFFRDTVDFNPDSAIYNLSTSAHMDLFLLKLNSAGNFNWVKQMDGHTSMGGQSIAINSLGYIYSTASYYDTVDINPNTGINNLMAIGSSDIFVQKLDTSGNFHWGKSFGGIDSDAGMSIALDPSGNIYVTGAFGDTVDFDPGTTIFNLTSQGDLDVFILKLDSLGNFIWAKNFGGTDSDHPAALTVDDSGNVFTTGYFQNTVDFNPNSGIYNLTAQPFSCFIQKMDSSGNFIWAKSFAGKSAGYEIKLDNLGSIYTIGVFAETVDFDPSNGTSNLTSIGLSDVFIHKLSSPLPLLITQFPKTQITLSPNPTTGFLQIKNSESDKISSIKIFTSSGQQILHKKNIESSIISLELNISAGIYFVEIEILEKRYYKKIVKLK